MTARYIGYTLVSTWKGFQFISSSIYSFRLNGVLKGHDFISKVSGENTFQFSK